MDYLSQFFEGISSTINTVVEFFQSVILNFRMFFDYLSIAKTTAQNLITTLPDWLQVFGTICLLISVLYLILGREEGAQ